MRVTTLFPYTPLFRSRSDVIGETGRAVAVVEGRIASAAVADRDPERCRLDRKSTRLNSSHGYTSHAVFCLKKKTSPLSLQWPSYLRCYDSVQHGVMRH